jgi:hypothetical protein
VRARAEQEDESFAAEKRDIMSEIEGLAHDDPTYRLRPSPSMSRGMATSMSFSVLNPDADSSRLLDVDAAAARDAREREQGELHDTR